MNFVPRSTLLPCGRITMSKFHHSKIWGNTLSYPQYPQQQRRADLAGRRTAALGTVLRRAVPGGHQTVLQEVRHVLRAGQPERILVVDPCFRCREHRPEHHHRSGRRCDDDGLKPRQPRPRPRRHHGNILLAIWAWPRSFRPWRSSFAVCTTATSAAGWLLIVLVPFLGALALSGVHVFAVQPGRPEVRPARRVSALAARSADLH